MSNRTNSRVSFTEPEKRSRKERNRAPSGQSTFTMDPDGDDVSLARFGVRCETATPTQGNESLLMTNFLNKLYRGLFMATLTCQNILRFARIFKRSFSVITN